MFGTIILRASSLPGPSVDVGFLAECVVFYKRVLVVGNAISLKELLTAAGPASVMELIKMNVLEFHFTEEQLAVATSQDQQFHNLIRFTSPDHTIQSDVPRAFAESAGTSALANLADDFAAKVKRADYSNTNPAAVAAALADHRFVEPAVEAIIRQVAPRYLLSATPRFRPTLTNGSLHIRTNLDFARLNAEYHQRVPVEHSSLSVAYLLAQLQDAAVSLMFAAEHSAELADDVLQTRIHELQLGEVIDQTHRGRQNAETFLNVVLQDAHAIREAVNSGRVPFTDILELVDKSARFKQWLQGRADDSSLIRDYYDSIVRDSWVDRLPGRTARWALFGGLGLTIDAVGGGGIGTASAGLAASAIDAFLVDKLIHGWKPHHFVETTLRPALRATTAPRNDG